MPTATVTSKGQITIPVEVRRLLGLTAGSRVDFVRMENGSVELVPTTATVRALKGCVPAPAQPVSVADMQTAIAEEASMGGAA